MIAFQHRWLKSGEVAHFIMHTAPKGPESAKQLDDGFLDYLNGVDADSPLMHLIVDTTREKEPPNLKALVKMQFLQHQKLGWFIIIVRPDQGIQRMSGTIMSQSLSNVRFKSVSSLEEAIQWLEKSSILSNLSEVIDMKSEFAVIQV